MPFATKLSQQEINELQEIFDLVDTDHGGSISQEEVTELLNTLGIKATQEDVDMMIKEIDSNSDGEIDFEEFVAVMSRKVQSYYTADEVKQAFDAFRRDCPKGFIKRHQIETALTQYGADKLTKEQVAELTKELVFDDHDLFNYNEYVDIMMETDK